MTAAPEVRCKLYGRISRLSDQPREGPHWKAQDKYSDHPRDASTVDHKCTSARTWMNLRYVYKNTTEIELIYKTKKPLYLE